mmetsp:Transcript_16813/g.25223  ORF Transcript_16813/g.25223 Transcript_16813/m.25223 type:complete len:120 (-) Transcript_16813:226-585(-)|eukprot:CAMPEP_0172650280 /NCGR_PEP_ID=MMETSP1068-20121228/242212_1 /TAXON_ID=35684 /ORGANISM="Pseudopedinella elastica, Strain CCMP716" /LENGTH=119 /DNA_ID=CAMNT_0013464643 /DNA_START=966 /DNA_END=1325 /DNA_ORIENTATION=-
MQAAAILSRTLLQRSAVPAARTAQMALAARQFSTAGTFLDTGEVTARVIDVVGNFEKVDSSKVQPSTTFASLDLDSLDIVEVVLAIEEEFALEIPDAEADKMTSIADAVAFIAAHPQAK